MPKQKFFTHICAIGLMFGQVSFAEEKNSNQTDTESNKLDAPQFSSMASELGKFQHKLYLSIGTKWNLKVQQTMEQIGKDRVVFKFHVNPDGNINNIEIVEGNPNSKLATISKEAIADGGVNCGPFSEVLKKEKPNGFDWQLAYRIY
jgi:hypothetical protein